MLKKKGTSRGAPFLSIGLHLERAAAAEEPGDGGTVSRGGKCRPGDMALADVGRVVNLSVVVRHTVRN